MNNFSIIIPTFREKKNIYILVKKIKKFLNKLNYEIIFVDDDSQDGSYQIFKDIKKKKKNFLSILEKIKQRICQNRLCLALKNQNLKI